MTTNNTLLHTQTKLPVIELDKLSILFFLRLSKLNARGLCPIMCRITISGKRSGDFSTGQMVSPKYWNQLYQKASDNEINLHLDYIKNKINQQYILDLQNHNEACPQRVRSFLFSKPKKAYTLKQLIEAYMQHLSQQIDKEGSITLVTYNKYQRLFNHIISATSANILATDFNAAAMDALRINLLNKNYLLSYTNKHIKLMKQLYKWAMLHEYVQSAPVLYYKIQNERQADPVFLTLADISKISLHNFASNRLQCVADCFLFQCYTGIAYADLVGISLQSIVNLSEIEIIKYQRTKTGQRAILPLSDLAKNILIKHNYALPLLTNQKYNAYLKEIADIVGIDKRLTTHVGRKTFTNTMINEQIYSIDTIARMLGHANAKTTLQYYGSVGENRLVNEILSNKKSPRCAGAFTW